MEADQLLAEFQKLTTQEQNLEADLKKVREKKVALEKKIQQVSKQEEMTERENWLFNHFKVQSNDQSIRRIVSDALYDLLNSWIPVEFAFDDNHLKINFSGKTFIYEIYYEGLPESKVPSVILSNETTPEARIDYYTSYNFLGAAAISSKFPHIDPRKFSVYNTPSIFAVNRAQGDPMPLFVLKLVAIQ